MQVQEFYDEFRRVMDDVAKHQLWSDEEILNYLNSAIDEACERARLIEDRVTPDCCAIDLATGTADYPLHQSVLHVKRVTYLGQPLEETSVEQMDRDDSSWETRNGPPCKFIQTETSIRIVPTPTAAAVAAGGIALTVYRTQLTPLASESEEPEIPVRYHLRLMPWTYRCALMKTDSETKDMPKALEHEAIFIASFGQRPDANVQRKRRDRRPPTTRMVF